jgi:propanediol utilization protein
VPEFLTRQRSGATDRGDPIRDSGLIEKTAGVFIGGDQAVLVLPQLGIVAADTVEKRPPPLR